MGEFLFGSDARDFFLKPQAKQGVKCMYEHVYNIVYLYVKKVRYT